ncbi:hypothetical protein D3C79_48820 [compost metagenome]
MPIPRIKITKNEEVLALTLGILRLGPLYLKYDYLDAQVCFDWAEDRKSVTLSYYHSGVLCYKVEGRPYKEDDLIQMRLTLLEIPELTEDQKLLLSRKTIITDFYNLLGVICRKVYMNNGDLSDTPTSVVRTF